MEVQGRKLFSCNYDNHTKAKYALLELSRYVGLCWGNVEAQRHKDEKEELRT